MGRLLDQGEGSYAGTPGTTPSGRDHQQRALCTILDRALLYIKSIPVKGQPFSTLRKTGEASGNRKREPRNPAGRFPSIRSVPGLINGRSPLRLLRLLQECFKAGLYILL